MIRIKDYWPQEETPTVEALSNEPLGLYLLQIIGYPALWCIPTDHIINDKKIDYVISNGYYFRYDGDLEALGPFSSPLFITWRNAFYYWRYLYKRESVPAVGIIDVPLSIEDIITRSILGIPECIQEP